MEAVVINPAFWNGRRVFLTGHTGFKGAWTALLLRSLGARVFGFALPPEHANGLFVTAGLQHDLAHLEGDLLDLAAVETAMAEANPEVVIHMAAQSLVRRSYADPVMTYATNVMGTVHVLEAARHLPGVKAVVIVTSDKCYENRGSPRGYRESDALGGHDPYSSSKACAELVADSYRRSFFAPYGSALVASVRAGNVVGGGDWAEDRAVPDAMRAFIAGAPLKVRNPNAVRPWQHVLDPVLGYLMLAEGLYSGRSELAEAWNFAPRTDSDISVASLADALVRLWGTGASWEREADAKQPYEAPHLRLDCSKAVDKLGWRPSFDLHQTLALTVDWYRALEGGADMRAVTLGQIERALPEGAEPRAAMASDLAAGLDG